MRTLHVFAQDMLGGTFLYMVGSNREQSFLLFYHDDVSIFVHQLQHWVLEFVIVLCLADLYFHARFQGKVVLGGDDIVYQYNSVGKQ